MSEYNYYRVTRTDCDGGGGAFSEKENAEKLAEQLNEKYETDVYEVVGADVVSSHELLSGNIVNILE